MTEQESNELKARMDKLEKRSPGTYSLTQFLFQAAMPVAIALVGIVFTYTNNRRQIEFQQIQVADGLISEVRNDPSFTQDKLDLKLDFIEQMFRDQQFKQRVKDLLTQTYAITLKGDAQQLEQLATSTDPQDVQYVQTRLAEARKFNDTTVKNVVAKLEKSDAIKTASDVGDVKAKAREEIQSGGVNESTIQQLKTAQLKMPSDTNITRLLRKAEQKRIPKVVAPPDVQPKPGDGKMPADSVTKKIPKKKKK